MTSVGAVNAKPGEPQWGQGTILVTVLQYLLHHRLLLAVLLAVTFGLSVGLVSTLEINDAPERWTPASLQAAWDEFSRHFPVGDTLAVALHFPRPVRDDDIFLLRTLRARLLAIDGVRRVYDLSLVTDQVELVPLTRILRNRQEYALYEGALFDRSGRTLVSYVELGEFPEAERDRRRRAVVAAVERVVREVVPEQIEAFVVGGIVIQYRLERMARQVLFITLPAAWILTLLSLYAVYRTVRAPLLCSVAAAWAVAVLLALAALLGWPLDVVTMAGPALVVILVLATTIHICHHSPNFDHLAHRQRVAEFATLVALPCLGAGVTTSAGFAMLVFNELLPIRQLGVLLAAGALLSVVAAFAVWALLPIPSAAPPRVLTGRGFRRHLIIVTRRRGWWFGLFVLGFGICAVGATRIRVSTDPFSFVHPSDPIARALDHMDRHGFGVYSMELCLVPRDGQNDAEDLRVLRAFLDQLKHPQILKVVSSIGLTEAAGGLTLANLRRFQAFQSVFSGWLLDRMGQQAVRVTLMCRRDEKGFGDLVEFVRSRLPSDRFRCVLAGNVAQIAVLSQGLVTGLVQGLATAAVVIGLVCVLLFRSVPLSVAAFLPNVFPVVLVFGLMGWSGLPLDSGSAMVATIALGIALSDTIHLLAHYHHHRRNGLGPLAARRAALVGTGRPIVLTSAVLVLGFALFLSSPFKPLYHFGLLASVAMVAALAGDLVLLVDMLDVCDRGWRRVKAVARKLLVPTAASASSDSAMLQ